MSLEDELKRAIADVIQPLVEKIDALARRSDPPLIPAADLSTHRPGFKWNTERKSADILPALHKQNGRNFIDLKVFDQIVQARMALPKRKFHEHMIIDLRPLKK